MTVDRPGYSRPLRAVGLGGGREATYTRTVLGEVDQKTGERAVYEITVLVDHLLFVEPAPGKGVVDEPGGPVEGVVEAGHALDERGHLIWPHLGLFSS